MSPWGWQAQWQLYQNSTYPGPGGAPYRGATGTVADRAYGRDLPFFWSEVDLRGYRVTSRYLAETNPFAIGFTNLLVGYHVRKGYGWQACRKGAKKTPYPTSGAAEADPLVAKGQRILDEFRDANQWPLLSREAFYRWRVDGETFLRIGWSREDDIWARFVEPEQVGAPDGSTTDPWSYGIDVYEYPDGRIDPMRVLAYHVWDLESGMTGGDWVDSKYIVHAKANVVAGVKRGRPDFFPVLDLFDGVRKLYTNMLLTAVDQAAVAWMEKFPTASLSQVASHIPQQSLGNGTTVPALQSCGPQVMPGVPWYAGPGGGNRFQIPGAIYRVEGNREVVPMPTGTGTSGFMEVEKLAMRAARCRWNMPGGVSGDTDDTNFASAIVAGGPFPVAVEGSQVLWGASFERPSALRVLDRAVDAGRLTREERAALDVEVTEPAVVTPEPDKDTTRRQQLNAAKVLSVTTWQLQEGLDPQHESENFQAEAQRAQAAQPAPQPGAPAPADPNAPPPAAGDIFGESLLKEEGQPPFPGAVFNRTTHHWEKPDGASGDAQPAAGTPRTDHSPEALKAAHKALAAQMPDLPEDHFEAMGDYTSGMYEEINASLREGRGAGKGAKVIPLIAAAIDSAPTLPEPVTVYRGIRLSAEQAGAFLGKVKAAQEAGEFISDPAFMSTSLNPAVATGFGSGRGTESSVVFQIAARKGLYLGESVGGTKEMELVLQRGSKFRVVGVEGRTVKLEQVL